MGGKLYPSCQVHCFTAQQEEVKECQEDSEALAIQENREFSISVLTRLNENT